MNKNYVISSAVLSLHWAIFLLFHMKLDNINRNDEEYPLQNSCDHCCQFNTEARQAAADNKQNK